MATRVKDANAFVQQVHGLMRRSAICDEENMHRALAPGPFAGLEVPPLNGSEVLLGARAHMHIKLETAPNKIHEASADCISYIYNGFCASKQLEVICRCLLSRAQI